MRINIEFIKKKDSAAPVRFEYSVGEPDISNNGYMALLGAERIDYIKIDGEIAQKNGLAAADYIIEAAFTARCARCGAETEQLLGCEGAAYIAYKSEDKDDGGDFYVTETDGILDLDDFIVEFLGVNVPYRYLCSEGCKGLCHKCGKNLNDGACGCPDEIKNPAFKILDGFFEP